MKPVMPYRRASSFRALLLLGAMCGALQVSSAAAQTPASAAASDNSDITFSLANLKPDLDDLWIIELKLRGRKTVLSDVLAYGDGSGDNLFVPILQIADTLDFVFDMDTEETAVSGWFIRENQTFFISSETGRGQVAGQDIALSPDAVFTDSGDIYVPLTALSDWFQLGADWVKDQQYVKLDPPYLLPGEEAARRGSKSGGARGPALDVYALPRASDNYQWISWPHSSTNLSLTSQTGGGQNDLNFQASTILSGDLMKFNGTLFASAGSEGFGQARLRLGRVDPDAQLFGPLKASRLEFGDITLSAAPLVQRASNGAGFRLAREPLERAGNFDSYTLEGPAFAGWQAELYRDNELLSFQTIGAEGRYVFPDIPLVFGVNRFRVELYGPQGQTRTEEKTVDIDQNLIKPGDFNYSLEFLDTGMNVLTGAQNFGGDPNNPNSFGALNRGMRGQAVFGYGLNRSLAMRGTASWQEGSGTEDIWLGGLGFTGTQWGMLANFDALIDRNGKIAQRTSLATDLKGLSLVVDREDFQSGFTSNANQLGGQSSIKSSTGLRADTRLNVPGLEAPIGLGANFSQSKRTDGGRSRNASLRTSGRLMGLSATHTLNWQDTLSVQANNTTRRSNRLTGTGALAGRVGPVRLRTGLDYDLRPEAELRRVNIDATTRWRKWSVNGRVSRDFRTGGYEYGGGLSRSLNGIRLGMDLRHNTSNESTSAILTASFDIDRDPVTKRLRVGDTARTRLGSARVKVFMDHDQDGIWSEGDEFLPADKLVVEPRGRSRSLDDGSILIETLPADRRAGVAVDRNALSDPFAIPANDGQAFVTRPGVVSNILLPVIASAEAEFLLLGTDGEPLVNQIATLTSCDGETKLKERAAYDGLVFFQFIRPGCYEFSSKGQVDLRFDVKAGDTYTVKGSSY